MTDQEQAALDAERAARDKWRQDNPELWAAQLASLNALAKLKSEREDEERKAQGLPLRWSGLRSR